MAFHTYPSNDILSSYITSILTTALTILALPTVLVIWSAQSLAPNRTKAQATSLPYLVRYISTMKSLWLPYGSSIVRLCQRLGIASEDFTRIYSHGWEANERAQSHADYGDTFLVVHPAGIQLCVSDSKLFYEILARKQNLGGIWRRWLC